jgi:hypothetical protein
MRIYIAEAYRGERSNGVIIPAGEYDLNDDILWNAGGYFIEHGFAVVVADAPPADEPFNFEVAPEVEAEPEPEPKLVKPSHKKGGK